MVKLFAALFIAHMLFSCGESKLTPEEHELYYNHLLLKAYFYQPGKIKNFSAYEGMEIDSMYESLNDYFCGVHYEGDCSSIKEARYTRYYPPEKSDDKINEIQNTKKYYSFGFERYLKEDTLIVSYVYPISPAAKAGLKKRDRILSANGIPLDAINFENYLKSDSLFDNSISFTVLRENEILTLDPMQKNEVQKPTVYLDSLDDIPFIRVTEYKINTNNPNGTYAEFKNYLQEIKGAKTAIMDLRNNGGGSISHCSAMAAELVPFNSELIYDQEHYYDKEKGNVINTVRYYVSNYLSGEGDGLGIKWIILINRYSASCSERFVAAVKYNRPETVVIGETSYGKGIGQMYTKTYLGGLAYITCLQSFYPNGETFHNIGIVPDIVVNPNSDDIYHAAIDAAQQFDPGILAKRRYAPLQLEYLPPERKVSEEELKFGAHKYRSFHQWE